MSVPLTNASNTLPSIYDPKTEHLDRPAAGRRGGCRSTRSCSCCRTASCSTPARTPRRARSTSTRSQWTTVGTSPIDGQSAVMYRPGKILKSGTWSDPEFPGRAVTNRAAAIDMTAANPAWREVAPMKYRRSYHTLTVLPDGKVLATGGQTEHRRRRRDDRRARRRDLGPGHRHVDDDGAPPAPAPVPLVARCCCPTAACCWPAAARSATRRTRSSGRDLLAALPVQGRRARRSPARPTALNYGQQFTRRHAGRRPHPAPCRWSAWARSRTTSTWTSAS